MPGNHLSHTDVILRLIPIIGLIMLSLVVTVSAYDRTLTDSEVISIDYTFPDYYTVGGRVVSGSFHMAFANIEAWTDVKVVYVRIPLTKATCNNWSLLKSLDSRPQYVDFIVSGTSDNIGNGYLTYNIFYDDDNRPTDMQFWVEINEWNIVGLSGNKNILMQLNPDSPLKQISLTYWRVPQPHQVAEDPPVTIGGEAGTRMGMYGYYIVNSEFNWVNTITINDDRLTLIRDGCYSKLTIQTGGNILQEASYEDRTIFINPPITWTVTNGIGTNFSDSYEGESSPADPTVTVYVKNAQTGALLADAHLTILDGQTGAPAVNQTLPAGSGSFSLQTADYFRYLASATAEGYTLLSPIQFGVGDDGTTIILWMSPNAPSDEPIEEGKSMLYGYIQTQGSQQPISGATVSLDGYGSTTTSSTGFYLFNNITPGTYTLSASAPLHDALSEPVTVDSAPTPHNLALKGHFLLTVTIKDGDTLANLQNATISLSDGQESTQNPATFTTDYGPYKSPQPPAATTRKRNPHTSTSPAPPPRRSS